MNNEVWIERTPQGSAVRIFKTTKAIPSIRVVIPMFAVPKEGEEPWVMKRLWDAGVPFSIENGKITKNLIRGRFRWERQGDECFVGTWTP